MALHDYNPERTLACGIAGLSVVADAFSAIKHARVKPIRDARGLAVDEILDQLLTRQQLLQTVRFEVEMLCGIAACLRQLLHLKPGLAIGCATWALQRTQIAV